MRQKQAEKCKRLLLIVRFHFLNKCQNRLFQGKTGGNRTEVVDIPNQADLDSYAGTFLGFGEIGENSTTHLKNN